MKKISFFVAPICFVSMANAFQKYECFGGVRGKESLPPRFYTFTKKPISIGTISGKQFFVSTYTQDEMSGGADVLELTISSNIEKAKPTKQTITSLQGLIRYIDSELWMTCVGI